MTINDKYILKAHIAPFMFGTFTVMFLFLLQFVLNYLDRLVGKGLDTWVIIQLIAMNLAWMVVLAVPMGVLFSTLMAFGRLSAANEITIIKSSGGSLIKMMRMELVFGLILSFGLFWFNDSVLPDANHYARVLMNDITRKKPTFSLESGQFSSQIDGYTIIARSIDSLSGVLHGVTIYDNSGRNRLNLVSADSGTIKFSPDYSKLVFHLFYGEIHQMVPNQMQNYKIIDFDKYLILMNASGFNFERSNTDMMSRGEREMCINDMQKIVNEAEKHSEKIKSKISSEINNHLNYLTTSFNSRVAGQVNQNDSIKNDDNNLEPDTSRFALLRAAENRVSFIKTAIASDFFESGDYLKRAKLYKIEIYKKYAIPFACFIFVLVGCPLGIMTRGGNFGLSAAITLGFYIFYWACLIGGEKLADRGYESPVLSMWLGNIIIGVLGLILTMKVNNESLHFSFKRKKKIK